MFAIPDAYRKEAKALSSKHVPPQWIRSDVEKNDYPISDWLQGRNKEVSQFRKS